MITHSLARVIYRKGFGGTREPEAAGVMPVHFGMERNIPIFSPMNQSPRPAPLALPTERTREAIYRIPTDVPAIRSVARGALLTTKRCTNALCVQIPGS